MPDGSALDAIREYKPVNGNVSATDITNMLESQRKALLEVSGDGQRTAERMARMEAELSRALAEAKRDASVQVVALGGAAELDRLYLRADGSVRLQDEQVPALGIGGDLDQDVAPGLLTSPSVCPEQERLRAA